METCEKFADSIDTSKGLMFPSTYCGEFVGWDHSHVECERNGILTVRWPEDMTIRLHFRRDELEQHGHARNVELDGTPHRLGERAFVFGQWDVELDDRGCPARYILRKDAEGVTLPSLAWHSYHPMPAGVDRFFDLLPELRDKVDPARIATLITFGKIAIPDAAR